MTREEIEKIARNCGSAYVNRHFPGVTSFGFTIDCLTRFVELVEGAEREACIKAAEDAYIEGRGAKGVIDAIRERSGDAA